METSLSSSPVKNNLPGPRALITEAIRYYRKHFLSMAYVMAPPALFALAQALLAVWFAPLAFVAWLGTLVSGLFAVLALNLGVSKELFGTISAEELYTQGRRYLIPFIWLNLIRSLVVMGGILLLIVPGIWIGFLLSFSGFALFRSGKRGVSALIDSWHYVEGRWWAVFWRFFVFGLLLILALSVMGALVGVSTWSALGQSPSIMQEGTTSGSLFGDLVAIISNYFLLTPLTTVFSLIVYKHLSAHRTPMSAAQEVSLRKKIVGFSILGLVAIALLIAVAAFFGLGFLLDIINNNPPLPDSLG